MQQNLQSYFTVIAMDKPKQINDPMPETYQHEPEGVLIFWLHSRCSKMFVLCNTNKNYVKQMQ